jgi:hypothetical protein
MNHVVCVVGMALNQDLLDWLTIYLGILDGKVVYYMYAVCRYACTYLVSTQVLSDPGSVLAEYPFGEMRRTGCIALPVRAQEQEFLAGHENDGGNDDDDGISFSFLPRTSLLR